MSLKLLVRRALLGLLAVGWLTGLAAAGESAAEVVRVAKGFDQTGFNYQITLDSQHDNYRLYRLSYPSPVDTRTPQNNVVPAELYMPKGITPGSRPRPAVICLHILGGGFELARLQCSTLAARGIPALWFKLPYYAERAPKEGTSAVAARPREFSGSMWQAVLDVRRTIDVLASRSEVDAQKIGLMGVSLGGILAATAAGDDARVFRTVLLLAGGDLLSIVRSAGETHKLNESMRQLSPSDREQVEQAIRKVDPLEHAAGLRARAQAGRVLMLNAAEDEVIPRSCTQQLAAALGIEDRVVWFQGLGHYTALKELPKVLTTSVDFFAQDMPSDSESAKTSKAEPSAHQILLDVLKQCTTMAGKEPATDRCHRIELALAAEQKSGTKTTGTIRIVRGPKPKFSVHVQLDGVADVAFGCDTCPWLASSKKVFRGSLPQGQPSAEPWAFADPRAVKRIELVGAIAGALAMAPEMVDQWASVKLEPAPEGATALCLTRKGAEKDRVLLKLRDDRKTPETIAFDVLGWRGVVEVRQWKLNAPADGSPYREPTGRTVQQVDSTDVAKMFGAVLNFAVERISPPFQSSRGKGKSEIAVVGRDPAGHGLLCHSQGKRVLIVAGTPEQMGAAQGTLLRDPGRKLVERVAFGVGATDSIQTSTWSFDRFAEIQRRTGPHIPPRFLAECDALAAAAGIPQRDARVANLLPERFHCSGVALRGKATVGGQVLHARVLDYMRDIGLQDYACVTVFMPEKHYAWISAGYAGFVGTVTAMNEHGLAIGEMGGGGVGNWDGMPMSLLLRDIMERAATVDEALAILRTTPRTCEYYYVVSDPSGAMVSLHCKPESMIVLQPGEQHPRLPRVPEDTVLISGDRRAQVLGERIVKDYGQIDVPKLIEIIKRPVAMASNLHDAIFSPQTREFWVADAGRTSAACDEPYAHFNLRELLDLARMEMQKPVEKNP